MPHVPMDVLSTVVALQSSVRARVPFTAQSHTYGKWEREREREREYKLPPLPWLLLVAAGRGAVALALPPVPMLAAMGWSPLKLR